jgi:hypothetical protein
VDGESLRGNLRVRGDSSQINPTEVLLKVVQHDGMMAHDLGIGGS